MAVQKLSQIAAAGGPPAVTDQAVFVTGGATDNLVTVTQIAAGLPAFTAALKGSVPASGGGTTNFLRADGTFAAPPTTSPGGVVGQVQWNNTTFAGMSGTSWDDTNRSLTMTGATVTVSHPVFDMTQTWNAGGVVFTGLRFNYTNTASAAASLPIDIQNGGNSVFQLVQRTSGSTNQNDIAIRLGFQSWIAPLFNGDIVIGSSSVASNSSGFYLQNNAGFSTISSSFIGWTSSATDPTTTVDTRMTRAAAKVVAFGDNAGATNGWIQTQGLQRVGSDVGYTSTTVLTQVMSAALQAGRTYSFDVYLSITGSTGGVQAAMVASGGLTATDIRYDGYVVDNAAAGTKGAAQAAALGTVVANPATITGPASAVIRGTITVNGAGTISIQASQASNSTITTTVKRGSYAWIWDMP